MTKNNTYTGFAINAAFEKGGRPCTISVYGDHINFSLEGKRITFPIRDLEVSAGGAGSKTIYFRHPDFQEWCFYSSDKALLKNPYILNDPKAKQTISSVRSGNRLFLMLIIGILSVILLFIGSIFIFSKRIVHGIADNVPVEWEQQAGEAIFKSIKENSNLISDSLINSEINILGNHITKVAENAEYSFTFYIINDSTLNAFALPGGNVVIHSGLIMASENPEEILGVLGHEIAHITERHHARGLISKTGLGFIISSFFGTDSELANLIINTGGNLQSLKYDRDLEIEADEKGWEYLKKANINPQGMITFFKKLEAKSPPDAAREESLSFLSTHPATSERIASMEKKLNRQDHKYSPLSFDLEGLKKRLKEKTSR